MIRSASFIGIAVSIAKFALVAPALAPFLVVLAINLTGTAVSLTVGMARRRMSVTTHLHKRQRFAGAPPSVDVFLPTAGEPTELLENTYRHIASLRWEGELMVYVLDDGDRPEVRDLALTYGFAYLVRENRGYLKKAGNMRAAFTRTSVTSSPSSTPTSAHEPTTSITCCPTSSMIRSGLCRARRSLIRQGPWVGWSGVPALPRNTFTDGFSPLATGSVRRSAWVQTRSTGDER